MDNGIALDYQVVDLMTGEHLGPAYASINPSKLVPMLEDGDFRLTESSAILKYLADKVGSAAYPKDLQKRARVNETMDWLNTGFYRDFGYGLRLSAAVPAPQAAQRRGARWRRGVGQAESRLLVRRPRPALARQRQDATCAATT